jgi:hypothetical protein
MTQFYRLVNGQPFPYSVDQFRKDFPHLSISNNPHMGELRSYLLCTPPIVLFIPRATSQPEYDPNTHNAIEALPEFLNGEWYQKWELVQLLPPPPEPNWDLFESLAIRDTSFDNILGMGLQPGVAPAASVTLSDAMREVKIRGEVAVPSFRNSWTRLCRKVNAPQVEIQRFAGAAMACNLPDYFIQAILAPLPEE